MFTQAIKRRTLDDVAIALSGICLVHCLASAVIVTLLATVGGMILNPIIHEIGLSMAMGLGAVALGQGVMKHGYLIPAAVGSLGLGVMAGAMTLPHGGSDEIVYSIIGVMVVALGHDLNRRAHS